MNYELRLYREATKTLDRLDAAPRAHIHQRLGELQSDPLDLRISKGLQQAEGAYVRPRWADGGFSTR